MAAVPSSMTSRRPVASSSVAGASTVPSIASVPLPAEIAWRIDRTVGVGPREPAVPAAGAGVGVAPTATAEVEADALAIASGRSRNHRR